MIVVDASVAALLFADSTVEPRAKAARAALARDPAWCVPEHWKIELLSVVRGLWLGRKIGEDRAQRAIESIPRMAVSVVPTDALLPRIWELRANVSGYDAAYIAAAEACHCALVTADARLKRSATARCPIDLVD